MFNRDCYKRFYNANEAMSYAEHLSICGAEDIIVSAAGDGFKQVVYIVAWNEEE